MKTIGWGIIGCGNVTEVKSGPGFQQARNSRLVAVMRRNGSLAADYAARHGVPRWYDDAGALIGDPEVDAVYVATPPASHAHYAIAAARAGKPVYVEKPMARTHDECVKMIDTCRDAGTPLFVAYYRRALPRFLKVKQLLDTHAIGELRFVSVRLHYPAQKEDLDPSNLPWRVIPEIAGGGRFVDLASHTLDLLDFLLGPVSDVAGIATNQGGLYPAEDMVTASMVHVSGVHVSGTWCFGAFGREDTIEFVGSRGKITLSTFGSEPVRLETADTSESFPIANPSTIQLPLIQTVVDTLNGSGECPSTGQTAARTSLVIDRILQAYRD